MQNEEVKTQVNQWKNNIAAVDFELFSPESWHDRVYFNQPADFSNEKIFDPAFIAKACELLKTDKLIISIARRHRMQITNYYDDFQHLEDFFWSHFCIWRGENDLDDEVISEMVIVAEKNQITHIVPLGFRMNMYEKDGQRLLNYSTMDDFGDEIDFQQIIEKNKIAVNSEIFKD